MNVSGKHGVHLDLNHGGSVLDDEFGVSHLGVADFPNGEACFMESVGDFLKSGCDGTKGLGSRERMIGKDQIEIDGETGHVPHEEVDGCASLEREKIPSEYIGGNP